MLRSKLIWANSPRCKDFFQKITEFCVIKFCVLRKKVFTFVLKSNSQFMIRTDWMSKYEWNISCWMCISLEILIYLNSFLGIKPIHTNYEFWRQKGQLEFSWEIKLKFHEVISQKKKHYENHIQLIVLFVISYRDHPVDVYFNRCLVVFNKVLNN